MEGVPQELLDTNIEKYVLEMHNKEAVETIAAKVNPEIVRKDEIRDPAVFYSNDFDALTQVTESLTSGEFFLRQSNLEDLFLKITGRRLNVYQ